MTQKNDMIRIRCRTDTKIAFKTFTIENNFRNMEDALIYLLRLAKEHQWDRRRETVY